MMGFSERIAVLQVGELKFINYKISELTFVKFEIRKSQLSPLFIQNCIHTCFYISDLSYYVVTKILTRICIV